MGCNCGKNKAAAAGVQRPKTEPVRRVVTRNPSDPPMPTANAPRPFRRLRYLVTGPGETENYGTLASAQKRLRDLGAGWSVAAVRDPV